MMTARQIFRELGGASKQKAMDFLRNNQTSRRIFRNDFTKDFMDDLTDRRDSKLDQHIILNTFGETGCLDEGTLLLGGIRLGDLKHRQRVATKSVDFKTGEIVPSISKVFVSGEKEVFQITLVDGREIIASSDHKFFVEINGKIVEKTVAQLKPEDKVVTV